MMKLTTIFYFVCLMQVSATVYSQTTKFSFRLENKKVVDVLRKIEDDSQFRFFYQNEQVDVNRRVTVKANDATVEQILDEIFADEGIGFKVMHDFLILLSPEEKLLDNLASMGNFPSSQQPRVSGKVTDSGGQPLPGVTVIVKGTTRGTVTDADGEYLLSNIPEDAVLVFSFVGMQTQEIEVGDKTAINVVMEEETIGIEEVVAIGYGSMKRKDLTGSVTTVNTDELESAPVSKMSNILAGRLSGVYVQQSTGVPGVSSSVRVRSAASWNPSNPVYVIDGVVRDKQSFDMLDVNEVEDITILKDAASAAIYGSRSANGVILVTTKSGFVGKPKISFSASYNVETPTTRTETLDAYTSALLNNEFWQMHTGTDWFGPSEVEHLKEWGGVNYYDELYRNPASQKYALSTSGGSEKIQYYLGASYFDQTGFLPNMDYSKYNLRGNIDVSITDGLKVGLQLSTNYGSKSTFNTDVEDVTDWFGKLDHFFFYVPIKINGILVNPGWIGSMMGLIEEGGYIQTDDEGIDAQLRLDYKIPFIKGLSLKGMYSKNNASNYYKRYFKQPLLGNFKREGETSRIWTDELLYMAKAPYPPREYLQKSHARNSSYQFNAQLVYEKVLKEHNLNATAIFEQYDGGYSNFYLNRKDFPIVTKDQFFATSGDAEDSSGSGNESYNGRKSFISRINYQYAERYLFSASFRADGSMLFAPDNRWGYFPSISAGWRISEENFFKENINMFSQVKLRASLGYTGNDAVGGWQWQEAYYPAGDFYFGNGNQKFINYGGIVNNNLTWEKSRSVNVGLDIVTIQNLGMSLDYWQRHTYDILAPRILRLPTTFGGTMPDENYGEMNSGGFDFELNYGGDIGSIGYEIRGNFSYATTKVIERDVAPNALDVDDPNDKPLGYIATLVSTGIIRSQEELDALPEDYTIYGRQPVLGHLNYEDVSGIDGGPDGKIDSYDRQIISDFSQNTAPYSAGLNLDLIWKGFQINAFLQSIFGYQKLYNDNWGRGFNLDARPYSWWADHWTADNPNAKYPAMVGPGEPPSNTPSTFWYEPGGFVRFKNLAVGYNLPSDLLQNANIEQVKLYINGSNLFFLSPWKHYDPEINANSAYPNMRTWSLGLNIVL